MMLPICMDVFSLELGPDRNSTYQEISESNSRVLLCLLVHKIGLCMNTSASPVCVQ